MFSDREYQALAMAFWNVLTEQGEKPPEGIRSELFMRARKTLPVLCDLAPEDTDTFAVLPELTDPLRLLVICEGIDKRLTERPKGVTRALPGNPEEIQAALYAALAALLTAKHTPTLHFALVNIERALKAMRKGVTPRDAIARTDGAKPFFGILDAAAETAPPPESLADAVRRARNVFADYADEHAVKAGAPGITVQEYQQRQRKARHNRRLADSMERALAAAGERQ